jgi:hypothetical protein
MGSPISGLKSGLSTENARSPMRDYLLVRSDKCFERPTSLCRDERTAHMEPLSSPSPSTPPIRL